jgi:hypothetical protein
VARAFLLERGVVPLILRFAVKLNFGRDIGRGANLKSTKYWSEWQDLNLRPLVPNGVTARIELQAAAVHHRHVNGCEKSWLYWCGLPAKN